MLRGSGRQTEVGRADVGPGCFGHTGTAPAGLCWRGGTHTGTADLFCHCNVHKQMMMHGSMGENNCWYCLAAGKYCRNFKERAAACCCIRLCAPALRAKQENSWEGKLYTGNPAEPLLYCWLLEEATETDLPGRHEAGRYVVQILMRMSLVLLRELRAEPGCNH